MTEGGERVRRYLLVLDTDLLAVDEALDMEPINYLVARQEQELCEAVVMSLVRTRQARLPAMELLLGARVGKFPVTPQADHDISAAAEHRMNLAMRYLKTIGFTASGLISDEYDLVKAVRSETRSHDYDEVILATSRQGGSWLARGLRLDPIHRLRRRLRQRLIMFPLSEGASSSRLGRRLSLADPCGSPDQQHRPDGPLTRGPSALLLAVSSAHAGRGLGNRIRRLLSVVTVMTTPPGVTAA
jgi:hypothetical protein